MLWRNHGNREEPLVQRPLSYKDLSAPTHSGRAVDRFDSFGFGADFFFFGFRAGSIAVYLSSFLRLLRRQHQCARQFGDHIFAFKVDKIVLHQCAPFTVRLPNHD